MRMRQLQSGDIPIWASSLLTVFGGAGIGKLFDNPMSLVPVLLGGAALFAGLWLQFRTVSRYRRFATRHPQKTPAARRQVLIVPLSSVPTPLPGFVTISGDLEKDLDSLAEHKRQQHQKGQRLDIWSWEQTLRGLYHQVRDAGPLSRLILLGSKDSVQQIGIFVTDVMRKYSSLQAVKVDVYLNNRPTLRSFDELVHPLTSQNGFDFEDFEVLTNAFGNLLDELAEQGISATNVQIDLTGGQKPTSVVAAAVTFFSNAANQYVATNPKDWDAPRLVYEVLGYDVREVRQADD